MTNPKPEIQEITRVEIAIPYNTNTFSIIMKLRDYVIRIFGGLTYSRIGYPGSFEGAWKNPMDSQNTNEDISLFILYFRPEDNPRWQEALNGLAKMILDSGEIESWLVFQGARCFRFSNSTTV